MWPFSKKTEEKRKQSCEHQYTIVGKVGGRCYKSVCDKCNHSLYMIKQADVGYKLCEVCNGYGTIGGILVRRQCEICGGEGQELTLETRIDRLEQKVNEFTKEEEVEGNGN